MSNESSGTGYVGQTGLNGDTSTFNVGETQIEAALGKISTLKPVKIMAVTTTGALDPVGYVDVQPMINLVDGLLGNSMKQETVYHIPYVRLQGGKNAIIMDPEVGDLGYVVVADRDISAFKEAKDAANPGSLRRFNLADGVYVGGILNGVPEQYVQFNSDGITIADKHGNKIEGKADGIHFNKLCVFDAGIDVKNQPAIMRAGMQLAGNIVNVGGGGYTGNFVTSGTIQSGTISLTGHHHTAQGATAATTAAQA
jgi:hypothetical protein